ncbi:MAG: ATP-binding protein, partial [Acidimicrobiia bacterium]|nr:ATP-binding protein [Acidimicrobiia bacterium]
MEADVVFENQHRVVEDELCELLAALPAISIEGARAVGKTWTASRHANTVYALDDPDTLDRVRTDPRLLLEGEPPILIDEWQRYPASWDIVRRAVDADFSAGRFILTGSTRPETRPTHSGAGRIVTLRMWTTTLFERRPAPNAVSLRGLLAGDQPDIAGRIDLTVEEYAHEITAGGFPGWRHVTGRPRTLLLDGYLHRLAEHDFPLAGHRVRNVAALRRWLAAYAAATAGTASYETIRDAATSGEGDKPAKTTTIAYRDTLEAMWLLEPQPAWLPTGSHLTRLKRSPKHHLADTALAARLLNATPDTLLGGHTAPLPAGPSHGGLFGALFESMVAHDLRVHAQASGTRVAHMRTWNDQRE